MTKLTITATAALLAASFSAQAALESRAGGAAYYDTDTDLTWTTDISPLAAKTADEHRQFFADFFLPGWRIPTDTEIRDIAFKTFTCEFPGVCTINEPFHRSIADAGWFVFQEDLTTGAPESYYSHGSDGKLYQGYSPYVNDYDGSLDGGNTTGPMDVWPVHNGDVFKVAVVSAVPEPSTYLMLIAGILLVSIGRKFV